MAPPSRASLTLRAAKKLEADSEAILGVTASSGADLAASKFNSVYTDLSEVRQTLTAVKDLCDIGSGTYPSYPAVREVMLEAGNVVYNVNLELDKVKQECLVTPITDLAAWHQLGMQLADLASRLRAVKFVPARKRKETKDA